jgi:hypothetical protein
VGATPSPIINPSAVRIRISNSPFTGAIDGANVYQQQNPDGDWTLLLVAPHSYRVYTNLDETWPGHGVLYPTFPRLHLQALDLGLGTGLQFSMEAAVAIANWGYHDGSTAVEIGAFYGTVPPSTLVSVTAPPFYVAPGYGTVEILEWIP